MIPMTTPVKRSRVGNIDTDRLVRRRYFVGMLIKQHGRDIDGRSNFAARVAELGAIESELVHRGALSVRGRLTTF